jgi:DNA topoisomerase-1
MVGRTTRAAQPPPLWKVPPKRTKVIANTTGTGDWVEKWWNKDRGQWVHNYALSTRAANEAAKFRELKSFASSLPKIRGAYRADLKKDGRVQVIALIVALIDQAFFRIGTRDTDHDDVYGATTLRKRHLSFHGREAHFEFFGKAHQEQHKMVCDPAITTLLKKLRAACRSQHDRLFRHEGRAITASEVNVYLASFGATAKQFRTYHATRLAREKLLKERKIEPGRRSQAVSSVVVEVAEMIGHEPATCRKSYIDPRVVNAYLQGRLA